LSLLVLLAQARSRIAHDGAQPRAGHAGKTVEGSPSHGAHGAPGHLPGTAAAPVGCMADSDGPGHRANGCRSRPGHCTNGSGQGGVAADRRTNHDRLKHRGKGFRDGK